MIINEAEKYRKLKEKRMMEGERADIETENEKINKSLKFQI